MASAVTGGIGMVLHRQISRRDVLRAVLVSGAALAVPSLALAEQCRETPRQDEGPFYLNEIGRSTRLNSSHVSISYAVFCLKKKTARKRPGKSMAKRLEGDYI